MGQERILISNFCHVLIVVNFLLGDSTASEVYVPMFQTTLSHLHRQVGISSYLHAYEDGTEYYEMAFKLQTPVNHPEESIQQGRNSYYLAVRQSYTSTLTAKLTKE
jgi:hypothetical protein